MPTLLLSPRHSEDTRILWRAAMREGWQVHRVHNWRVPDVSTNDLTIYGEPLLTRHIARQLRLHLEEPPLDWLPQLPSDLRKRDVRLTTLGEARQNGERAFVKPADEKGFDATVSDSGAKLPGPDLYPDHLPVLIQEVVHWQTEFRCFVLGTKVLTAAPYWLHGKPAQDPDGQWLSDVPELLEAIAFAEQVLSDSGLLHPNAFVLDVGQIADRGWAVIEANAATSSGLYGCDPSEALKVIRASVRPA